MIEMRNTTLQQRLGFQDEDLKKPQHDGIVIWCTENMEKILHSVVEQQIVMGKMKEHWGYMGNSREASEHCKLKRPLEIEVSDILVEKPILNGTYIVGFSDIRVNYYIKILSKTGDDNNNATLGKMPESLIIEVKTKIPSVGELLRQIEMYQQYAPSCNFCIVSPDTKYKDFIKKQGICFY